MVIPIKRTYKYYLKLTDSQKRKLDKTLELCCWLNNFLLEKFRERDKTKQKQPTEYQLINSLPEIKKQYPFLKEVHSSNLQEIAKRVHKNWRKYKELKKLDIEKNYPKFKPVHRYNSIVYNQHFEHVNGCGYKIDNSPLNKKKESRKLKLAFGNQNNHRVYLELKITMERIFEGNAKSLTIKRKNGNYYALFSCDNIPLIPLTKTNQNIGIDVNLNQQTYITLSNGKKYKHPQIYKKVEEKLKDKQRILNRKVKGSQNWKLTKLQFAKKWEKVVNQSKYYSYQVANELVKDYDKIVIEDLSIYKMVRDNWLSKHIQQSRWGVLFQSIAEAAEIATRKLVRVKPYNTSQICSDCGKLAKVRVKLNQRVFECWSCGLELNRDVNSARNILNRAIIENRLDQHLPLNKENNFTN